MNLSQLLEVTCAKPTWLTNQLIKKDPKNTIKYLTDLNETVIKYLGNSDYYERVKSLIIALRKSVRNKDSFVDHIRQHNLYIEVPSFSKIQLRELLKHARPKVNENLVLPKKLIKYMKQKLGCFQDLIVNDDIVLPNVFVGPIYVCKLMKLVDKLITYRDFGSLKGVTGQPTRGRALGGGSSFGQMEIESCASSGCTKALKEFTTIKNDWNSEKRNFLNELIKTGTYHLPDKMPEDSSRTKIVINAILDFLKK